jgi:hypothetical protein
MSINSLQLEMFPAGLLPIDAETLENIRKKEIEKKQAKLRFFLKELSLMNKEDKQVRLAMHMCEDLEKSLNEKSPQE